MPDRPGQTHHGPSTGGGDRRTREGDPSATRRARLLQAGAILVLCPVAVIAAALSFQSLHEAAAPVFGPLAVGFPLLVDMLILGSTLAFLAGASVGRALPGWRWTAHTGVSGTLLLNVLAASSPATIAWHVTPALVWSVLVEMSARQVTGHGPANAAVSQPIPARIWLSSPLEAIRTWLQMARTGQRCHRQARADLAVLAAAKQALRTALPQRRQRGARRLINRQLRAGALDPWLVLDHLRGQPREDLAEPHTTVVIQTLLEVSPSARNGASRSDLQDSQPPGSPGPVAVTGGRSRPVVTPQPSAGSGTSSRGGAQRPALSPEHRHRRRQAAVEILRTRPEIDAPRLAQELTHRGWPVSRRTALRVLVDASHHIAAETADTQTATAVEPPTPDDPARQHVPEGSAAVPIENRQMTVRAPGAKLVT